MILSVCPNPSVDTYAWLEFFENGKSNRIEKLKEFPGGKGIHVALSIAELGGDSNLIGNFGGPIGEWIKKSCSQKNVPVQGVELRGNNRKCYTFRSDNPSFSDSELLEPGPELNEQEWESFVELFSKNIQKASLATLSGSWPTGAPDDAYLQLINIGNETGTKIILDCSGVQLKNALNADVFGLHLNEDEAEEFCGSAEMSELLKILKDKVKLIALSKGKKGLDLYFNGEMVAAKVDINEKISAVGSGDCLTAGIAYAVQNNLTIEEIAKFGVACGAANCITEDLGMFRKKDVLDLLDKVELSNLI